MVIHITYGQIEYKMMFLSLFNTPASFQECINKIPAKKLDIFSLIYLDNILIYTWNLR